MSETINSPIFQNTNYSVGGIDVGVTQYGDAIQRAQFWNLPGFSQSDYHVLLDQPTVVPTSTFTVPSPGCGASRTASCGIAGLNTLRVPVGRLDVAYFDAVTTAIAQTYPANVLTIFLTDNVFLYEGAVANCCILGYHSSEGPPLTTARTWIFNAYTEAGTFVNDVILDVQPLSHEVAEWMNDPFVADYDGLNLVPPYVLPGQAVL